MILDHLSRARRYSALHPGFAAAWDVLESGRLEGLAPGKHELDGERLYVMLLNDPGRGRQAARLEAHRKYIDIQCVLSGTDLMGWRALSQCSRVETEYDPAKDVGFYAPPIETWIEVPQGHFVIFYPDDPHAPLAGEGPLRKAVFKVAVEW